MKDWLNSGWLTRHETTPEEISNFLALADRDIHDAQNSQLSEDWQFNIAYNAALQLANAALAASGYRVGRGGSHHHHAIQSLSYTLGAGADMLRLFDRFRKKRNIAEYDAAGMISGQEAGEMLELAIKLRTQFAEWLQKNHPELLES